MKPKPKFICPKCGAKLEPSAVWRQLGAMSKGKAKPFTAADRKARAERLARFRHLRWPKPPPEK